MRSVVSRLKKLRRPRKADLPPEFVEADYLHVNPDVAYAIGKGLVRSGADHWLSSGAREGRRLNADDGYALPADFDEEAYLLANPDIRVAVRDGVFPNGTSHWLAVGHKDGRRYRTSSLDTGPAQVEREWEALVAAERSLSFPDWGARSDVADPGEFDALAYASNYPDVVRLVGATPDRLQAHWLEQGYAEGRTPYAYRPYLDRQFGPKYWQKDDSISFFGLLDATSGLGVSARGYLKAIENTGIPVHAHNVVDCRSRFQTPDWRPAEGSDRRGDKVNIFHLNADMTHRFFLDGRRELLDHTFNVAIWFWELPDFRRDWMSAFGAFDEIWVASEFVRRSIASVSPIPVIKVPMVVPERDASERLPRSHFDIPDAAFAFACIFDVGSVIARKNPGAAIRSFKEAFGRRDDVLLLLKYHGGHHYPESLAELRKLAGSSPNIRFYDRNFSEREMQSFTCAIDCLVSPHRSEGFGLSLAEAMLEAKPVIATGFSGNLEFMTAANSHLIDFELRELGQHHGPYPAGALWAEPKIDDLTARMRSVFDDRDAAAAKAEVARADILAGHDVDTVSRAIRDRFGALQLFSPIPRFVETWGRGLRARTEFHNATGPRISLLISVDDIEGHVLHRRVRSVLSQSYALWELILYGAAPMHPDTLAYTNKLRGSDHRIKVSLGNEDKRLAARNDAVALSSGEFMAMIHDGDELAASVLSEVAVACLSTPGADLIYFDEDEVRADGRQGDPDFKSAPSPDPRTGLTVWRRSLLLQIGAFRDDGDAACDDDWTLRASRVARETVRLPKSLTSRSD